VVERLPGARIGLGGTKQIVERQGGQRTSSNSTEAPTFTSSAAYAAESRAEIPRGDPAVFAVVAADSRPISTAPFEHGHPVTIHETPWCPIILSGRGAEHHALAISTGDTQAIAGLPTWRGRWRAWYAPRCRRAGRRYGRLVTSHNPSGLSCGTGSQHVCARAGFPARKDHPRGEYSSHQQAAQEGAA